jgi:hypothetical protein
MAKRHSRLTKVIGTILLLSQVVNVAMAKADTLLLRARQYRRQNVMKPLWMYITWLCTMILSLPKLTWAKSKVLSPWAGRAKLSMIAIN